MKKLSILLFSVGLSLSACKQAEDLAKYKDQVVVLTSKFGPQLTALTQKLPDLIGRAKALPVNLPGVDKVTKLLDDNQAQVAQLQGVLSKLPSGITGKGDDIAKSLDDAKKQISDGIAAVNTNVSVAEAELGKLEAAAKAAPPTAADAAAGTAPVGSYSTKLSSGFELKANPDGVEAHLVEFLQDASKQVDKTTWFDFDRLAFQTGKAELDADKSKDQLANITEILRAFPTTKLKIGGYTDNTGPAAANKEISTKRAEAVVAALVANGIAKDRLEAEGYGPEHPACPANDTEECKAKNRRIAIRVTAK